MLKNKSFVFLVIISILFFSCKLPKDVKKAFKKAGKNYKELEKVIEHYKNDSLKLKAVYFLISNMIEKHSYTGYEYFSIKDSIIKYASSPKELGFSLKNIREKYVENKVEDIQVIKAEYIIENIDAAFIAYQKATWNKSIPFEVFLEYILPYKLGDEALESWRDKIFNFEDSIFVLSDLRKAAEYKIKQLNKQKQKIVLLTGDKNPNLIDIPYSFLELLTAASCKELSYYTAYILRTFAIPCAIDFTPNYANLYCGHSWNVIIFPNRKNIPFVVPSEVDTLGRFKTEHYKLAKVYRKTYSINKQSHIFKRGYCSFLPEFYNQYNIIDVTNEYIKTCDVKLPVIYQPRKRQKFAYIAVYNGSSWVPIGWGKIFKNNFIFENIGTENVYLPIAVDKKNVYILNYPFIPYKGDSIKILKPDNKNLIDIHLRRKYPLYPRIEYYINRMKGGKFQGANKSDFSDTVTLYILKESPGEYFNEIILNNPKKFRYIRYIGPIDSYCNVAEIEFYEEKEDKTPLKGKIIGTEGINEKFPERTKEKAFDGDVLTFYHAPKPDNCWVGLDLGNPKKISKIRFIARTDYNIIVEGNIYEVFYWDNKWISLGKQTATSNVLVYKNVPSNCLYFIRNLSGGVEERIFTYEDGKQIWW